MMRRPLLALVLVASPALASAQTIQLDTGTPYVTTSPAVSGATGGSMAGMGVTVFLTNSASFSDTWKDLGGGFFGVTVGGFDYRVGASSDTYGAVWTLSNNTGFGLSRMVLVGSTGNTVFDYTSSSNMTPGTGGGRAFSYGDPTVGFMADPYRTVETYRNAVHEPGQSPVGDIYETLDVTFGSAIANGAVVIYGGDTDNVATAALAAPEPGTWALFATGLISIGLVRRRRSA